MTSKPFILAMLLAGSLNIAYPQSTSSTSNPSNTSQDLEKILSQPTGKTDWNDPVSEVAEGCIYLSYPTPSRGEDTTGSSMVYLPPSYNSTTDHYPVIYYLHGGTGNQREGRWLTQRVDAAIKAGKMNPVIIVCPQALPIGWYINANTNDPKVTSGPIEDVIIRDLIPYMDANFRTIPTREGRGIEGFSMGGRGTLMLAFKHPDLFGAASSVAGALVNWDEEPLKRALECTFGDIDNPYSKIYFDAWHPQVFACQNASHIISDGMKIRMFVGDQDRLYNENGNHITERFHNLLDTLSIPHTFTIVPGANHNPLEIFDDAVNKYDTSFWDDAFSKGVAQQKSADNTPDEIKAFISTNFPTSQIKNTVIDQEANGDHYTVSLDNNVSIKFNEHFKWIKVDASNIKGNIPATMILPEIQTYISANNPDKKIIRIEKVPRTGYDILLSDGTSLLFDTTGAPISR